MRLLRDVTAHTAAPVLALLEEDARGARSQCGAHAGEAGEAAECGLIIAAASRVRYSQITGAATPRTTTTTTEHPMGVLADALRSQLRELAQSDARLYRSIGEATTRMKQTLNEMEALPASTDEIAAAIALLEANGYTVTRR